jgi:hypothetical protein
MAVHSPLDAVVHYQRVGPYGVNLPPPSGVDCSEVRLSVRSVLNQCAALLNAPLYATRLVTTASQAPCLDNSLGPLSCEQIGWHPL